MRKLLASRKWQWDFRDEAEKYVKTNHPAKSWDPEMQKFLIVSLDNYYQVNIHLPSDVAFRIMG